MSKQMSRYVSSVPARVDESEKTERPMFCGVEDCQSRWDPKNAKHIRGFADVVFTLADGTVIARCGECYTRHIYACGRGTMSEITGRQPTMTLDLVREHWARVDAAEEAKKAKVLNV